MGVHDGKPEIYLETLLDDWRVDQGNCGDLAVRLQCTEICAGGLGFEIDKTLADSWKTRLSIRLYSHEGPTSGSASIWVEDDALWIGYEYATELIACRRIDAVQVEALECLADAMDEVF